LRFRDETLRALAREVRKTNMEKNMVGWDLEELEAAAKEMAEREEDSDDEEEEEVARGLL